MNRFLLSGTIAKEPTIAFMEDGTPMSHLSLKEVEKGANGKVWENYHHLPLFGPLATEVDGWRMGDHIVVEGKISKRKNRTTGKYEMALRVLGIERIMAAPEQPNTGSTPPADDDDRIPY